MRSKVNLQMKKEAAGYYSYETETVRYEIFNRGDGEWQLTATSKDTGSTIWYSDPYEKKYDAVVDLAIEVGLEKAEDWTWK